jgi:hypothetical protein
MDAKRTKIYISYRQFKHALMAGLAPSLVFLRDSIDKDHFNESLDLFTGFMREVGYWISHVKKNMEQNGDTISSVDIEKIIKHPEYVKYMEEKKREELELQNKEENTSG